MAYEQKTRPTPTTAAEFIAAVEDPKRRADAEAACALLAEATGEPPVMWGPSIIGFGRYTYVNTTNKPADWPIIGFSPRKAQLVLYIMRGFADFGDQLARLGKHKSGGGCLYISKLDDVDLDVLREMAAASVEWMRERYPA